MCVPTPAAATCLAAVCSSARSGPHAGRALPYVRRPCRRPRSSLLQLPVLGLRETSYSGAVKAQSAVRAIGQAVAREHSVPVRRASKPRLLDLHRTAGNAAVTALVRGAGARAQA